jgi:hypothetical protein
MQVFGACPNALETARRAKSRVKIAPNELFIQLLEKCLSQKGTQSLRNCYVAMKHHCNKPTKHAGCAYQLSVE